MEGVQADQGLRGLLPDDVVDPLGPVGGDVREQFRSFRSELGEERFHAVLAAALGDPGDPPGFMVGDDGEVLLRSFAPGFLVDPDHPQALQAVQPGRGLPRDANHDVPQCLPGDPKLSGGFRPRHLPGQPRGVILERAGETVIVTCPRNSRSDLPVHRALDPRHRVLQVARFPCTSRVRHRRTSVSTGTPWFPHLGQRFRTSSSGSTTTTSTFSGTLFFRGHRSI